jgi:hypothetical protein
MLRFWKRFPRWARLVLLVILTAVLFVAGFIGYKALCFRRYLDVSLAELVPADVHLLLGCQRAGEFLWPKSQQVLELLAELLERPSLRLSEAHRQRLADITGEELLMAMRFGRDRSSAEWLVLTRIPFSYYLVLTTAFSVVKSRLPQYAFAEVEVAGKEGYRIEGAVGGHVYFFIAGDIVLLGRGRQLVSETLSRVGGQRGKLTPLLAGEPSAGELFLAGRVNEKLRNSQSYLVVKDILSAVPLGELLHMLDLESISGFEGRVELPAAGEARFQGQLEVDRSLLPLRLSLMYELGTSKHSLLGYIPASSFYVSLSSLEASSFWEHFRKLQMSADQRRSLPRPLGDYLKMVYRLLSDVVRAVDRKGYQESVLPELGPEVALILSWYEQEKIEGEPVASVSVVVQVRDAALVLEAADDVMSELKLAAGEQSPFIQLDYRQVKVRELRPRVRKRLAPGLKGIRVRNICYAVVEDIFVISTSENFVRDVIELCLDGGAEHPVFGELYRRLGEAAAERVFALMMLDMGGLQRALKGTAAFLAAMISDWIDRKRLRVEVRTEELRKLHGRLPVGHQREQFEQRVDALVNLKLQEERERLRRQVIDWGRRLGVVRHFAVAWGWDGKVKVRALMQWAEGGQQRASAVGKD